MSVTIQRIDLNKTFANNHLQAPPPILVEDSLNHAKAPGGCSQLKGSWKRELLKKRDSRFVYASYLAWDLTQIGLDL